jgi:N-acetylglucosaminyldiphosphoundecaprenol N-acetyl-beta-D-mannosaminyltransferase
VSERRRIRFLDCPFDPVSMDETVAYFLDACRDEAGGRTVVTANASLLVALRRDPALRQACENADLLVADGMSVVWATRLLGCPVPERVAGVDLMVRLLEAGARQALRVFFLGARPDIVARLVEICGERHPGLVVAGWRDGYFAEADHEAVIAEIREARPDILFVGMPTPFKEVWCDRHRQLLGARVLLGVGGSFDVLAGAVRRAPPWLQRLGMEWSWRLMMEPRKMWKRYLVGNSVFLWLTLCAALRRSDSAPALDPQPQEKA